MMQMQIRQEGVRPSDAIEQHVRDRLAAALDQHQNHIRDVRVTIRDVNGPRGGLDKACDVHVDLTVQTEPVIVKKQNHDLYLAVSDVADTLKETIGRAIDKVRQRR